jgi:hypothetical protein
LIARLVQHEVWIQRALTVINAWLADKLGQEHALSLYRAFDDAVDTVERIVREEQIACDFRRSGKIKLAAKPAHYESIARGFERLNRECDPETELLPQPAEPAPVAVATVVAVPFATPTPLRLGDDA